MANRVNDYFDDANQGPNLTLPMGVGNIYPLMDRIMGQVRTDQFLRELVLNSIQAGATEVEISPCWTDVERTADQPNGPIYRFMIADNGKGMDDREILEFFNKFSSSGNGLTVAGGNYGVGAKISCLKWNHHGVLVMSWKDGRGYASRLWKNPESPGYGVKRFTTDDGVFEVLDAPDEYKPSFIQDHGTVIVLCGNTGTEDTWTGPLLASGPSLGKVYSYLSALNNRFYEVPNNVNINVFAAKAEKTDWPKSREEAYTRANNDAARTGYPRNVKGLKHYLDGDKLESGILEGPGFKIHWYWANPDRPNTPYVMQGAMVATMYQQEIYDLHRLGHATSYFSKFGIYRRSVAKNVAIIVEPDPDPTVLMTDTARTQLVHKSFEESGEFLPWTQYGDFFRDNMPEVIQNALDDANESKHDDVNKAIAEDLKEYLPLMARNAFKQAAGGKDQVNGNPGADDKDGPGKNHGRSRNGTASKSNKGTKDTTSTQNSNGAAAKRINNRNRMPDILWVNGEDEGIEERIAKYDPVSHKLLINRNYRLLKQEVKRRLEENPSLLDYEGAEKVLTDSTERVYGFKLASIVVHHYQNKDTEKWTSDEWLSTVTPEALTFSVGGYKWAENIINRIAGQHLAQLRRE